MKRRIFFYQLLANFWGSTVQQCGMVFSLFGMEPHRTFTVVVNAPSTFLQVKAPIMIISFLSVLLRKKSMHLKFAPVKVCVHLSN